jgi:hypothetical protein
MVERKKKKKKRKKRGTCIFIFPFYNLNETKNNGFFIFPKLSVNVAVEYAKCD